VKTETGRRSKNLSSLALDSATSEETAVKTVTGRIFQVDAYGK